MSILWHPQNCGGNTTFSNCIFWNHKHRPSGPSVLTCITNNKSNPSPYGRSRLSFRTRSCIVTTNPVRTGLNPLPKRKICMHILTYPDGNDYSALTVMVCFNAYYHVFVIYNVNSEESTFSRCRRKKYETTVWYEIKYLKSDRFPSCVTGSNYH